MKEKLKTTLTFNGESVDFDDKPASMALVEKIAESVHGRSGDMVMAHKFPTVHLPNIEKLGVTFKKDAVRVSFEVIASSELIRLIHLSQRGYPLSVTFESPQAQFDLKIVEVDVRTGEVKNDDRN